MKNPNANNLPSATLTREDAVRLVATLDMIGTLACQELAGIIPPAEIKRAAILLLRSCRERIADTHDIGPDSQYKTTEFMAMHMMDELAMNGDIDENRA